MSIHELNTQNFTLTRDQKTLKVNVPGVVLIMYKMDGCTGCQSTEPILRQLAMDTSRVNTYAVLNISRNRDVAKMASGTRTPIPHVPYFILYINGEPKAIHKGPREYQAIKQSIHKALADIQSTQFVPPTQQQSQSGPPQGQRGGMYGQGGYSHPQLGGPNQGGYQPEFQGGSKQPNQTYARLNDVDEEDDERLITPEQVIPHNVPWESSYKRMGTID